jgi:hypothetical protein
MPAPLVQCAIAASMACDRTNQVVSSSQGIIGVFDLNLSFNKCSYEHTNLKPHPSSAEIGR